MFQKAKKIQKKLVGLLQKAFSFQGKTKGREKMIAEGLDNGQVADKLMSLYNIVVKS